MDAAAKRGRENARAGTYGLVLEEHLGVEVRDLALGVDGGADHLALACVHEGAHLEDLGGRAKVALSETATACRERERSCQSMPILSLAGAVGTEKLLTTAAAAAKAAAEAASSSRRSSRHIGMGGV